MTSNMLEANELFPPETVSGLQELIRALNDSSQYLTEAASRINDDGLVASTLRDISAERQQICGKISGLVAMADEQPDEDGTWAGKLRSIWTALRAAINAGDATVVLIEAERAEDAILGKFEEIVPQTAGTPLFDKLKQHYETVRSGHDRVLALRNSHQNNR